MAVCRHNLEAFYVRCDSSGFRGRSCSCAATISWLFHKCIQDIIIAAVYYCIFRVRGPEVRRGAAGLRSQPRSGQIWSRWLKKWSNLITNWSVQVRAARIWVACERSVLSRSISMKFCFLNVHNEVFTVPCDTVTVQLNCCIYKCTSGMRKTP